MPKTPKWNERPCPLCKEPVSVDASKCPHCQTEYTAEQKQALKSQAKAGMIGCGVLAVLLVLGVATCSGEDTDGKSGVAAVGESPTPPTPTVPAANYAEFRKGVYYYPSAISETDKANGRAAGEVLGFRYLGKNADGEHKLASASIPGSVATCGDPCSIIHLSDGQSIAFAPNSIIGAAFSDAINGHLTPAGGSGSSSK